MLIFFLGAIAPNYVFGLEQGLRLFDESEHFLVGGFGGFGRNLHLYAHAAWSLRLGMDGIRREACPSPSIDLSACSSGQTSRSRASLVRRTSSSRGSRDVAIGVAKTLRSASPSSKRSQPSGSMP